MGKMPLGGEERGRDRNGSPAECGVEVQQLLLRQGQEEALEKDDGLTEACVEVVVGAVEQVPFALGPDDGGVVQLFGGMGKRFAQIFDELQEGRNFVEKLRALAEKNAAADSVEAGGTATLGLLKIIRIERTKIRNHAKMFGMNKHCPQQQHQRIGKSFAECWSNGEGLMRFSETAIAAKAEGFIQIDTEHGVRRFKTAQSVQVCL